MLKIILNSSLAALAAAVALAPGAAGAQTSCQEARHDNRVIGTIVGGVAGALLGNAIGEHGGKEGGTIIGGVGGAMAGNAIGAAATNCANRYGHYDDNGRWVPNTVTEYGYYDANGQWVDTSQGRYGPPQTYGEKGYGQDGARVDTREQEDRLQSRIQEKIANGELDDRAGRHALRDLDDIRRMDADYRDADGHLNLEQRQDILARLDALRARMRGDTERAE